MSRSAASRGAVAILALLLASCGSGGLASSSPSVGSPPSGRSSGLATSPASATATSPAPSPTGSPTAAAIPGFEGWTILNPASVAASAEDGTLVLTMTRRALWFQAQRGVLVWKPVTGDFRITATVSVTRTSDPAAALDGGGAVRLGGLMARVDAIRENYVFVVVGADADGLSVETKSTRENASRFEGPAWPAPAADLRLCRSAATFTMLKRPAGSNGPWTVAATIERPDLPGELQVGPNIYTDGPPDLTARYSDVVLESPPTVTGCDS